MSVACWPIDLFERIAFVALGLRLLLGQSVHPSPYNNNVFVFACFSYTLFQSVVLQGEQAHPVLRLYKPFNTAAAYDGHESTTSAVVLFVVLP